MPEPTTADLAPIDLTGIKSLVTNLITSEATTEYMNFHIYPSPVTCGFEVSTDVGFTVDATVEPLDVPVLKHLYTLNSSVIT